MNTVLFITSSKMRNWKGTERFIYYLCTELTKLNIHTVIMENSSFRFKEPEIAFNANPQIEIVSVPFKKIFGIYFPPRNEIYRINPDVVYVSFLNSMPFIPNYRYTTIFGMHILHLGHLKYESLFKNLIFGIKRETLKFLSKLFWRRKKIIFHSLTWEQADWVKRLTGSKFNSVTIPLIIPCSRDYKKLKANDIFNILYFGSLSHEKGFDNFLILLNKLNNSAFAKDLIFTVAGAGVFESNLRQIMEKCSNIEFIKRPDDDAKFKLFSRADLFLYPSLTDVYPTVLAETQIFGIPAIVSDVSRPSCIVKEGETGYFLSLNDLESFIRKTEEYYYLWKNDPEDYEKMKDHIRELSKRLCSDNIIPIYNEMFKKLLK
jgi:glycosyltransferase involved in cell wall biosynthesis